MSDKPVPQHLFSDVLARVHAICATLAAEGQWPAGIDFSRIVVEPPRDARHGDMATNAAMVLAKDAKAKPRDLADKIAEKLREHIGKQVLWNWLVGHGRRLTQIRGRVKKPLVLD